MENLQLFAKELVQNYGYLGIFLISYTESIIQPIPPDPFIAGGAVLGLNPLLSALVSTVASVLGGLTAHFLGITYGEPLTKRLIGEANFRKGEKLMNRFGFWAVLIGGLTPVPYKVICWLAGIFEMRRDLFIVASLAGRLPRFLAVAYFGNILGSALNTTL